MFRLLRSPFVAAIAFVGSVLSLVSAVEGLITLSQYAHILLENWRIWTGAIWNFLFGFMHIEIGDLTKKILTLLFFLSSLSASAFVREPKEISNKEQSALEAFTDIGAILIISMIFVSGIFVKQFETVYLMLTHKYEKPDPFGETDLFMAIGLLLYIGVPVMLTMTALRYFNFNFDKHFDTDKVRFRSWFLLWMFMFVILLDQLYVSMNPPTGWQTAIEQTPG